MRLEATPPPDWDARIGFPLQSVGYAHVSRALGHRPLFAENQHGLALVLLRRVPMPILRAWTARAKVFAEVRDVAFLRTLVERLRALGVSHVKLGDSSWGTTPAVLAGWPPVRPVVYHAFANDLRGSENDVMARMHRATRRHVKRAREEVTVSEVRTAADLRDYLALTEQTGERMRGRDQAAVYPSAYFEALLREMVPRGQALVLIARLGEVPLAGSVFITARDRFVHFHGCSTRDRALTPKQGPTAIFWHAMQLARAAGCIWLNMGAVTPTDDPAHPHFSVYSYKRQWGGELIEVPCGELIVAPWKYRFQESVLAPLWDRLHPLYLRLFGEGLDEVHMAPAPRGVTAP
jgi:Acetyltransferase (GNAT) domain